MHKEEKFKEMVIYWESCHSGSMFQNLLPNNINVYALSASSPDQESYACYLDKTIRNYLGDCFSVHWMEDADIENLNGESLLTQYLITKYRTNTSTVEQWGSSFGMDDEKVGDYLGSTTLGGQTYYDFTSSSPISTKGNDPVRQSDVALAIQIVKLMNASSFDEENTQENELKHFLSQRSLLTETINKVILSAIKIDFGLSEDEELPYSLADVIKHFEKLSTTRKTLEECFYPALKLFNDNCFELTCNDYAIYQVKHFLPLCKRGIFALDSLRKSMEVHCKFENPICGIY
jgi:legumain